MHPDHTSENPTLWQQVTDALAARERQGMAPDIDRMRNADDVARTVASFAGEIRYAGPDRRRAVLIELAAEAIASAAAIDAASAAAAAEAAQKTRVATAARKTRVATAAQKTRVATAAPKTRLATERPRCPRRPVTSPVASPVAKNGPLFAKPYRPAPPRGELPPGSRFEDVAIAPKAAR